VASPNDPSAAAEGSIAVGAESSTGESSVQPVDNARMLRSRQSGRQSRQLLNGATCGSSSPPVVWSAEGAIGLHQVPRRLATTTNSSDLPVPAGYFSAPDWARIDGGLLVKEITVEANRASAPIALENTPEVDADPSDLKAVLVITTNVPSQPVVEVPWRLRVTWAQVCPIKARFDESP